MDYHRSIGAHDIDLTQNLREIYQQISFLACVGGGRPLEEVLRLGNDIHATMTMNTAVVERC